MDWGLIVGVIGVLLAIYFGIRSLFQDSGNCSLRSER